MSLSSNISPNLSSCSVKNMPESLNITSVCQEKKNTKRCNNEGCKAKLNLTDFDCKCGKRFCGKHRYFTDHACAHDYKKEAERNLTKQLVKCDGEKLVDRL